MSNTWSDFSNFARRNKNTVHVKAREVWRMADYKLLFIKSKIQGRRFKIPKTQKFF